jgi:hypothetical protein
MARQPTPAHDARKFNDLQCQTFLTALLGAKGIFLNCKTEKFTTPNADVYEPQAMPTSDPKGTRGLSGPSVA